MSMRVLTLALSLALLAVPAAAQEVDHSQHGAAAPAAAAPDDQVGNEPPPPVATDYAADRLFPADRMEPARAALLAEGRFHTSTLRIDRLEYRALDGRDGYAFEGEAWTGGDIDRFVIDAAGEGEFGHDPESVEISALWRHAIDPFFNLELGVRHDFYPAPQRTYAVAGITGLAPYWIELQGHLFLSDQGDAHVRIEAEHDMRITQKLIFQPAIEVDFALQDVPELGIGAGFDSLELGARLRYQVDRKFAPYLGVQWERKLGGTADFARSQGDDASSHALLFGIRTWF
jgi:copper resistance protein B